MRDNSLKLSVDLIFSVELPYLNMAFSVSRLIKPLLNLNLLYGFNLTTERKYKWICDLLYIYHILVALMHIGFGLVKSELGSSDIQKVMLSLQYISNGVTSLITKIVYRQVCPKFTLIIKNADSLLSKFQKENDHLPNKIKLIGLMMTIIPHLLLLLHYEQAIEIHLLKRKNYVQVGDEYFVELCRKYHLNELYHFMIAPLTYTSGFLPYCTIIPFFWLIFVAFTRLANAKPNNIDDIVKLVQLHQEACKFIKLVDSSFNKIAIIRLGLLLLFTLINIRIVIVPNQSVTASGIIFVAGCLNMLTLNILLPTVLNNKVKDSVLHLFKVSREVKGDEQTLLALTAKMDLYVTHVELEKPKITLGHLTHINPHMIIELADFILAYTFLLYSK
ncbi:hypothetical protein CHUAL_007557 [Chamberlinius hualienensis]